MTFFPCCLQGVAFGAVNNEGVFLRNPVLHEVIDTMQRHQEDGLCHLPRADRRLIGRLQYCTDLVVQAPVIGSTPAVHKCVPNTSVTLLPDRVGSSKGRVL